MRRSSRGKPTVTTGTEHVKRARKRWIIVSGEMRRNSLAKERFDGLKRCVEINGRQYIPKVGNFSKIRVVSEVCLGRKIFQYGRTGKSSG